MAKSIWDKLLSLHSLLVAIGVMFIVLIIIDCFDFLSRWSGHFMPYKDNVERVFYFVCTILLIWRMRDSIQERMKSLKVSVGDYGFEVKLGNKDAKDENDLPEKVGDENFSGKNHTLPRPKLGLSIGARFEMLAIDRMSKELGVCFSSTPSLRQGNMIVEFDGYAEKDGRVYVVEAKISDRISILKHEVGRMSMFAMRLPPEKRARLTFVLYVLTAKSPMQIYDELHHCNAIFAYDLQVRTLDPKRLEGEM